MGAPAGLGSSQHPHIPTDCGAFQAPGAGPMRAEFPSTLTLPGLCHWLSLLLPGGLNVNKRTWFLLVSRSS